MSVRYSDLSLLGRTSHRTCRTGPRLNSTWSRLFGLRNLPFHPYGRHRYFVNSDRQPDSVDPDVGSDDEKDDEAEKVRKALLEVKSADFMIRQNAFRHHTDQYDLVQSDTGDQHLVLRRGDSFDFVLTFNRPYNQAEDNVSLVFETGKNADDGDNTRVVLNFQKKDTTQSWQLMSVKPKGNTVELTVKIPPTCCIGKWVLKVNTISKDKEAPSLLEWLYSKPVYVLFNPWCKEDTVYHPDEQFKKDHLLEEDGGIYVGRYQWGRSSCKDWAFAPFDNPVLECTLKILEKTRPELRKTAYCDASKITRKLTSVINNIDNNGVLNGRWDGQYGDGDSPTSWNGSQAILEQYFKSGKPVKYGQCWVFSGVLTTCLRTLGIPARSVTNTDSAHDTDVSLTIDKYFLRHDSGQIDENETRDSVWNFHVWNDAWMARPDLVKVDDYDYRKPGWQACDATPQETSDGYYCCGPTPILAVKNGDVNVGFDGPFVFAEVNGDEVYWVFNKSENKYVVKSVHKDRVGTGLLTRKGEEMVNIIGDYKHLDAESEKKATLKATKLIPQANLKEVYKEEAAKVKEEIKMELLDTDETLYGDNFKVPVKITNNYKTKKQLYIMLQAESRFYTNASGDEGKKVVSMKTFNEDLKPGQNKTLEMLVEFEDYERYVLEGCIFKIGMFCLCLDDYDFAYEHDTITLSKPTITAKAMPSKAKVGDTVKVSVSFQNSLPKTLTQGYLTVEGTGLENRRKIKINKPVQPKQTFSHEVDICPAKEGRRKLLFDFDCNEMKDIKGMCVIEVTK